MDKSMIVRSTTVLVLIAMVVTFGCVDEGTTQKTVRPLTNVNAEDAPVRYIQDECLPILNGVVDRLCATKDKFPELAQLECKHITKPFDHFFYQFGVSAVRGQKAMRIEPGGCSIKLFLEPFSRSKSGTSYSHSQFYPNKEFDELAIRFNYKLGLGTPNQNLQQIFNGLVEQAITELAKKEKSFASKR
jgi:hypothetical protein